MHRHASRVVVGRCDLEDFDGEVQTSHPDTEVLLKVGGPYGRVTHRSHKGQSILDGECDLRNKSRTASEACGRRAKPRPGFGARLLLVEQDPAPLRAE
ncbi:hypothetical protein INR49_009097, partial [Caranx melampygus]